MKDNDLIRFAKIMLGMADNFRDTITKEGMDMRFEMLKGFSIEQIDSAAKKILLTRKYTRMPPIAEFIEAIQGQMPTVEDKALVIANGIIDHMRRNGSRVFPDFGNDQTAKRLMTKRWPYYQWAAEVLTSELKWWVKEFCEAYKAEQAVENYQMIQGPEKIKQIANGMFSNA